MSVTDSIEYKLTERWLDKIVIGLDLCPFAAKPRRQEAIRIYICYDEDPADILACVQQELDHLAQHTDTETTLIVTPNSLQSFDVYNQFLEVCDQCLNQNEWDGIFQIASFHPDYQFAGTHAEDAENLTNRAPYPTLHLIRESTLSKIIDAYPDTHLIPERNIALMNSLSEEQIKQLFTWLA